MIDEGSVTLTRFSQLLNAFDPIKATDDGIVISSRFVQPVKWPDLISVFILVSSKLTISKLSFFSAILIYDAL